MEPDDARTTHKILPGEFDAPSSLEPDPRPEFAAFEAARMKREAERRSRRSLSASGTIVVPRR